MFRCRVELLEEPHFVLEIPVKEEAKGEIRIKVTQARISLDVMHLRGAASRK